MLVQKPTFTYDCAKSKSEHLWLNMRIANRILEKLILLTAGLVMLGVNSSGAQEQVRFSTVPFIGSTPTNVAYSEGLFKEQGLEVVLTDQPGGWRALQDLFEGRADIAAVSDLPVVYSMFDKRKYTETDRPDFVILADLIYSQDIQKLVARRDAGINGPGDLHGKTIAMMTGSTIDFYQHTFFAEYGLDVSKVNIIHADTFTLVNEIQAGNVDAVFTWEPHVATIVDGLGENANVMSTLSGHTTAWLMVTTRDYAEQNPDVLERFLRAIQMAEGVIKDDRDLAVSIQAGMTNTDREIVDRLFDAVEFDLSLNDPLITTMEGLADWLIRTNRFRADQFPDLTQYFYFDAMNAVKPNGIGMLR